MSKHPVFTFNPKPRPIHNLAGLVYLVIRGKETGIFDTLDDFWSIQLDKMDGFHCLRALEIDVTQGGEESSNDDDSDGSDEDDDEFEDGGEENDETVGEADAIEEAPPEVLVSLGFGLDEPQSI